MPATPTQEFVTVVRDTNDYVSSMGVRAHTFTSIVEGNPVDTGTVVDPDPKGFNFQGHSIRRVEPLNSPTVIGALCNFDNFWNGRASFIFNGINPFGFRVDSRLNENKVLKNVLVKGKQQLLYVNVRITNSSLASQAVGPPLSDFEMSWAGRSFPKLGKKMLSLKPLALQGVSATDSVLGGLRDNVSGKGLNTTTRRASVPRA